MLEFNSLKLPSIVADYSTYFKAHALSTLSTAIAFATASDPFVQAVPEWWIDVMEQETRLSRGVDNDVRLKWLQDDGMFLDALAVVGKGVGAIESTDPKVADIEVTDYSDELLAAVRSSKIFLERETRFELDKGKFAYYIAVARAAEASRLGRHAIFSSERVSKTPNVRNALTAIASTLASAITVQNDVEAVARTFLTESGSGPDGRLSDQSATGSALAKLAWLNAFRPMMEGAYLTAVPKVADTKASERDRAFRRFIRARRVDAVAWRCTQELRLHVLRCLMRVLINPYTTTYIQERGMGEMLAAVQELTKAPGIPLLRSVDSWSILGPGETPYGQMAPRGVIETGVADALWGVGISRGKIGLNTSTALLAMSMIQCAHNYLVSLKGIRDQETLAMGEGERTLGLASTGPDLGRLVPPFGKGTRVVYTSGAGWSEPKMTLADIVGSYVFPAAIASQAGATRYVGKGLGHRRLWPAAHLGISVLDGDGKAGDKIPPSKMVTLARMGLKWPGTPFVYMEPDLPSFAIPAHSHVLPLSAFRHPDEFQGGDGQFIELGKTPEEARSAINLLLPDAGVAEKEALYATIAQAKEDVLTRAEKLKERTASLLSGSEYVKDVFKDDLTPIVTTSYLDDEETKPWLEKVMIDRRKIPFVWDANGDNMVVARPDRLVKADKPLYMVDVSMTDATAATPYDAAGLARAMSLDLAKAVMPTKPVG